MRSKEEAHDYRYFPDPDLLPLTLDPAWVEELRAALPELPDARKARFMAEHGLSAYDAGVLVAARAIADLFDAAAAGRDAKRVANFIMGPLFGALNRAGIEVEDCPVPAEALGALIDRVSDDTISLQSANTVIQAVIATGADVDAVIEEKGLRQVSDAGAIEALVERGDRRQPRQGRRLPRRQDEAHGLVRRPGDEGVGRQGQPARGQRGAAGPARRLSAGPRPPP